jgi:hypothetical protein
MRNLLPKIVVQATAGSTFGRREFRTFISADFPLGRLTPSLSNRPADLPGLAFASLDESVVPRPSPPLPPVDSSCLREIRRRAVVLAMAEPERARSYLRRAAQAAWLPDIMFRVDKRLGRRESVDVGPASTVTSDLGLATVNDVRYGARATWDLSRLVFSPDELTAQNQALRMAEMRRDLEAQIDRMYFEHRRLLMPVMQKNSETSALRQIRREELEAGMDALSDGAFSRCETIPTPAPQ